MLITINGFCIAKLRQTFSKLWLQFLNSGPAMKKGTRPRSTQNLELCMIRSSLQFACQFFCKKYNNAQLYFSIYIFMNDKKAWIAIIADSSRLMCRAKYSPFHNSLLLLRVRVHLKTVGNYETGGGCTKNLNIRSLFEVISFGLISKKRWCLIH